VGDPETLSRKLEEVDNNGWVDETLPLRMLHSMRDGMWRSRRKQGVDVSPIAEEPVLPHAAITATTPPPDAPRTVQPTVEALPALTMAPAPAVEVPATVLAAADRSDPEITRETVVRTLEAARHRRVVAPRLGGRRTVASAGAFGIALTAVLGSSVGMAAAAPASGGAGATAATAGKSAGTLCDSSGSGEATLGSSTPTPSFNNSGGSAGGAPLDATVSHTVGTTYFDEAGFTTGMAGVLTSTSTATGTVGAEAPGSTNVDSKSLGTIAAGVGTITGPWGLTQPTTMQSDNTNLFAAFAVSPATFTGSKTDVNITGTVPALTSFSTAPQPGWYAVTIQTADKDDPSNDPKPCGVQWLEFIPPAAQQTLSADIFLCESGSQSTDRPTSAGSALSATGSSLTTPGTSSIPSTAGLSLPSTSVAAGSWQVNATAPTGYHFVTCGTSDVIPTTSNPTSAQASLPVGQNTTNNHAAFYVVPNAPITQTLTGQILTCATNPPSEVHTGTLSATGPAGSTAIPTQADPINAVQVASGNWTVSAGAPSGTQFVSSCGQPGNGTTSTQTVNVPAGGSGTAIFYVTPNPNNPTLSLTKTANVSTVTAGDSFNWTLVAQNAGPGDATHAVVTDPVPNGLTINGTPSTTQGSCSVSGQNVTCSLGTLAANTSATIVINVTANGTVCGPIVNTGTLTTDQGTAQGTATVTVNCPNFSINLTKSASVGNNATITAGTSFTYTLVATNTGGAAANGVVVTDAIPSQLTINGTPTSTLGTCSVSGNNVTCDVGTLAANNGSATITINVGTSTSSCGVVNNMGQVTASGGTIGNSNTVTTTIACAETVGITVGVVKTNNAQDPTGTDYGKTETAQTLGETFNYQAVITNTSTVTEVIGTITDTIAGQPIQDVCPSLVGQTLAPQASLTCTFQGVAPSTSGASLTDTVTVPVSQQGTPTNTGTGTDTSTVNTPPGVIITKASNAAGTGFGQNQTVAKGSTSVPYQVTVTNPNSSPGTITSLTDTIDGTTTNICPDLIGTVLAPSGQPNDSVVCNFTTSVPTSVTTDTAAVNLSVNGVVVPGSAQTTVFPPVLGTQITPATPAPATPATPAPATLAFTGAPIGKLLASALGMIAMGLLLVFGLQVIDARRRPGLRFAVAERGRRAGPAPTAPPVPAREPSIWKGGNGYERTATAAAATWLADRVRSSFLHLRR
jgi:uncharacterized repeat protein (TIGR01451 family)